MKGFSYKVNLGIVGKDRRCNQMFLDYLERIFFKPLKKKPFGEKVIIIDGIPLKINPYLVQDFQELIDKSDKIKKLNLLIYVINIYEINSDSDNDSINYKKYLENFKFKGISALVGVDLKNILKKEEKDQAYYNEFSLISKARELDFIYCFKLINSNLDVRQIYTILFKDIIKKFKILNPDLYEKARSYALDLTKHS